MEVAIAYPYRCAGMEYPSGNNLGAPGMKNLMMTIVIIFLMVMNEAQAATWKSDKAHSQVNFSVAHLVISEVTGSFRDFDATIVADNDDLSAASFEATIKAESIDTGVENRDKHLRSDDFLNAAKFPEIKFKSTDVEETGDDAFKIVGDLTIRDVTKRVALDVQYKGSIKDQRGNTRLAFKATTIVDRFDYGVKWDKTIESGGLVAGKDVEITLLLEFVKQK
jgi:polyisoprenoid-binding protein YceI